MILRQFRLSLVSEIIAAAAAVAAAAAAVAVAVAAARGCSFPNPHTQFILYTRRESWPCPRSEGAWRSVGIAPPILNLDATCVLLEPRSLDSRENSLGARWVGSRAGLEG